MYITFKKSSTKNQYREPSTFLFFLLFFKFYLDVAIENIYFIIFIILFSHLADAFIQSDLQMRTTEAINCSIKTTKNRSKTKRYIF